MNPSQQSTSGNQSVVAPSQLLQQGSTDLSESNYGDNSVNEMRCIECLHGDFSRNVLCVVMFVYICSVYVCTVCIRMCVCMCLTALVLCCVKFCQVTVFTLLKDLLS